MVKLVPHRSVNGRVVLGAATFILWLPLLVTGIALTLSLFGAIFGIPILFVAANPSIAGFIVWRAGVPRERRVLLSYLSTAVVAVGGLIALWYGRDDAFANARNALLVILVTVWILSLESVTVLLLHQLTRSGCDSVVPRSRRSA